MPTRISRKPSRLSKRSVSEMGRVVCLFRRHRFVTVRMSLAPVGSPPIFAEFKETAHEPSGVACRRCRQVWPLEKAGE